MFSSKRHDLPPRSRFLSNWCGFPRAGLNFGAETALVCSLSAFLLFALPAHSTELPDSTDSSAVKESESVSRGRLKGTTQHIEYKLNDLNSYRKGMAAIDRKNFSAEESSGKARLDTANLQSGVSTQHARASIEQHITLLSGATKSDTSRFLLKVDRETIAKTVYNCFAEMTCLETAEIGSNINNAVGRWQPLLVEEDPAALALGNSNPQISVKMDGTVYKIGLPSFRGLKRILLATDGAQICAMDLDANDSWLLRLKKNRDGSLNSVQWAKLVHMKTKVERGVAVTAPKHVWDAKEASTRGWEAKTSRSHGRDEGNSSGSRSGVRSSNGSGGFLGGDSSIRFTRRGSRYGARGSSGF